MAATPPPRRRPGAVPVATLAGLVVVLALAALAFGRATPGGLRDEGPAQASAPPPVRRQLWPDLPTSPPPPVTTSTDAPQEPPQPVPDLTVPGHDITAVDVRTVLAKDPKVGAEERQALGSCAGCAIRTPEFRDLTGDGQPELLTVVTTPRQVVLHVYTLVEDRLLPVLQVPVLPTFNAATVGSDLWLVEPTSVDARTSSHYTWDGTRLVLKERRDEGVQPLPSTGPDGVRTAVPTPGTDPAVRPAPQPPKQAAPDAAAPSPRAVRPSSGPSAPAAPTAVPSAPLASPESKR